MKFVLNEYHRNISDEELLEDVKCVAVKLGKDGLTMDEYTSCGKYSASTCQKRFGGWNKTLLLCGLVPSALQIAAAQSMPQYRDILDEELLLDIRLVAEELDKDTISTGEYQKYGRYSRDTCFKRFGEWNVALIKAGLKPHIQGSSKRVSDQDIMEEIERLWISLGRQPTSTDIKSGLSKYSLNTFVRHFGGWRGALEAFVSWVDSEEPVKTNEDGIHEIESQPLSVRSNNGMHTTRRDIGLRLRFKVMQRDKFKCCFCGASPANNPSVELHIDHIIPWARGGETAIDNLQTLCSKCNLGKSDSIL